MTRLEMAMLDQQFEDNVVTSVKREKAGEYTVSFENGFSLFVKDEYHAVNAWQGPKVGDTLRLFGKGVGFNVRGIAQVVDGRIVRVYLYNTQEEAKAAHEKWVGDQKAKKRADWESKKVETTDTIAKLPEAFRKRVEFFMRNQGWGPEFGPYEIFCCTEAVKIAQAFAATRNPAEDIRQFSKAVVEKQKILVPGLDYREHSGNTFGTACTLASLYVTNPEILWQMHGALCPLVGCQDYGCYASTQEASSTLRRDAAIERDSSTKKEN